jgi:hypothetical protein
MHPDKPSAHEEAEDRLTPHPGLAVAALHPDVGRSAYRYSDDDDQSDDGPAI